MDNVLPIWASPHRMCLLSEGQREVFTFGFVLPELRALRRVEGVRRFGQRFGFEWLPGLARGVHDERARERGRNRRRVAAEEPAPSALETFLFAEHGSCGPREFDLERWAKAQENPGSEPPDDVLREFAKTDGTRISSWSANAFSMIEINLFEWARRGERVALGYGAPARRRLELTQVTHTLDLIHDLDGHERFARGYTSLYQRAALELEDLAVRRPKPRICPLCQRVYVPLRSNQSICSGQIWDATSRRLVRQCTAGSGSAASDAGEAARYRRKRKTRWMAMDRTRRRYGEGHERTRDAIVEWRAWRAQNPPPRPPGRPARSEPPFQPS